MIFGLFASTLPAAAPRSAAPGAVFGAAGTAPRASRSPARGALRRAGLLLAAAALAGCSQLPAAGPLREDVETAPQDIPGVALAPLTAQTVALLGAAPAPSLSETLAPAAPRRRTVAVGDRLAVSIWEPSPDGLFATIERKQTDMTVTVDEDGRIFVPYAGELRIAGLTAAQVRDRIEDGLRGKAVDPQVQVSPLGGAGQSLSVIGDVGRSGRYEVPIAGLRLADALAQAGGSRGQALETEVSVMRDGRIASARLSRILAGPDANILLAPGDTVQVSVTPRRYVTMGALGRSSWTDFGAEEVTLMQAMARAGGLQDNRADPSGMFVFRRETAPRAQALQDLAAAQAAEAAAKAEDAPMAAEPEAPPRLIDAPAGWSAAEGAPVIYQLDMRDPESFFLASAFRVEDGDVLFASNAPAAELRKFFSIVLSPAVSAANSTARLGN